MDTSDFLHLSRRVAELERQVTHLQHELDVAPAPPPAAADAPPGVMEEIRNGNLMQAIRLYREATGTDLGTAKDHVERLAAG